MVADLAIGLQYLLARAGRNRRIRGRPVVDIDRTTTGSARVLRDGPRGAQRDDQIEVIVLEFFQQLRLVAPERKPDLIEHRIDEGVALAGAARRRTRYRRSGRQ